MVGTSLSHYEVLEELGRGGMGIVYKALDVNLDRIVAIKVLPPNTLTSEDDRNRFYREARSAAALHHPHIASIFSIEETHIEGDTEETRPFIVMEYVSGGSLRDLLADGPLEVEQASAIAVQIAQGLHAAHSKQIVHRDIKPANIMVTEDGIVKILDFGIARRGAISELTKAGSTLGTANYMSPEQSRGESVTAAADLWSLGIVFYEMLAGKRPFEAEYEQALLYAILNEEPASVQTIRPDVPEDIARVVDKLLEKTVSDRFPDSRSVIVALGGDASATVSTGVGGVRGRAGSVDLATSPTRVIGIFSVVAVVLIALIYAAMIGFGLPDWVFPLGVVLVLLGAPVLFYASTLEKSRLGLNTGERLKKSGLAGWLTVKKAATGGVLAMALLGVISGGFMLARALGIGPAATLITSGAMAKDDVIVIADFEDNTTTGNLGRPIAEALRIDFHESPVVEILDQSEIMNVLQRMERADEESIDAETAREIAIRSGAKAFIAGDVSSLGANYVLGARILSAQDGSELVAARETAQGENDIVAAIDRLSGRLREQIGESLISIRAGDKLDDVTTSSLEALKLYTQGYIAKDRGRDEEARSMFLQAIELDSLFAMAYRAIAVLENNSSGSVPRMIRYATRTYELRERLPRYERLRAELAYYQWVERSVEKQLPVLAAMLEENPDDYAATNSLHLRARYRGEVEESIALARKLTELEPQTILGHHNLVRSLMRTGRWDEVEATIAALAQIDSTYSTLPFFRIGLRAHRDSNYVAVIDEIRRVLAAGTTAGVKSELLRIQLSLEMMHGRYGDAERTNREAVQFELARDNAGGAIFERADFLSRRLAADGNVEAAKRDRDAFRNDVDFSTVDTLDRGYQYTAFLDALLGETESANQILAEQANHLPAPWIAEDSDREAAVGMIALAENRLEGAVTSLGKARSMFVVPKVYDFEYGTALILSGRLEESVPVLERAANGMGLQALMYDGGTSTLAFRSLGEVYEELGRIDDAIGAYENFIQRWIDADENLRPQVQEVRDRISRLLIEQSREGTTP